MRCSVFTLFGIFTAGGDVGLPVCTSDFSLPLYVVIYAVMIIKVFNCMLHDVSTQFITLSAVTVIIRLPVTIGVITGTPTFWIGALSITPLFTMKR